MTDDTPTQDAAPASPFKRYALIVGGLALLLGVAYLIFGARLKIMLEINGLHAGDPRTRAAHVAALREHPDKELVSEMLADAVSDDSKSFEVRQLCANLLYHDFNRLNALEALLRGKTSLHTRGVVLSTMSSAVAGGASKEYFNDEVVGDPAFRVRETLLEWLAKDGDLTRASAIQLAVKIDLAEAMPLIAKMVTRQTGAGAHSKQERNVVIAAAGAALHFKDCVTVGKLLAVAASDPDLLVRLRLMQTVDRAVFRVKPKPICPDAVEESVMKAHVLKALEDPAHEVRMGAMLILVRRPAWATDGLPAVRKILASDGTGAERRHALELIAASNEDQDVDVLPEAFHDDSVEVRMTAARAVGSAALQGMNLEGLWIGLLGAETESQFVWTDVLGFLHKFARVQSGRLGFPPKMSFKAVKDVASKLEWAKDLAAIFGGQEIVVAEDDGSFMRITRASVVEAHFRWWCTKLGLDADQVEQAVAARKAFHDAKRRGDAKAAQAALEDAPQVVGLWAYERAWLRVKSKP